MKKVDWKDVWSRAWKTFLQTAGSYLIASLTGINFFDGDKSEMFWLGLGLSAGAAGLSAVWNGVIAPLFKKEEVIEVGDDEEG